MPIVDKKKQVMSQVSALNVLTEKMPKLNATSSFSSLTNKTDPIDFLLDLVKSLTGYENLKSNIVDLITGKLPEIEREVKSEIKKDLKGLVSCSVSPSIPSWMFDSPTDGGITVKLSDIDFYDIMKTDPEGPFGNLLYDDIQNGISSSDFNTFLYNNIKLNRGVSSINGGQAYAWGEFSPLGNEIIDVTFNPYSTNFNNAVNIKVNSNYTEKTLIEFNDDYIDSIKLFDTKLTFNNIINGLFNSVGNVIGKSKSQLQKEVEVEHVLDCIINADEDVVIDDSYFTFSNEDLATIGRQVENKSQGIVKLDTCGNLPVDVPVGLLTNVTNEIIQIEESQSGSEFIELQTILAVDNAIETISNYQAGLSPNPIDRPTIKVNFIIEIIKAFTKAISTQILSPKLVTLFVINHKIIYGVDAQYDGAIGYLKDNRVLIRSILSSITRFVVKMLLILALKALSKKLAKKFTDDEKDRSRKHAAQLLSLLGVEDKILRQIQGLNFVTVI